MASKNRSSFIVEKITKKFIFKYTRSSLKNTTDSSIKLLEYNTLLLECSEESRMEVFAQNWRILLQYKKENKIQKIWMQQTCSQQFRNNKSGKLSQIPWSVIQEYI